MFKNSKVSTIPSLSAETRFVLAIGTSATPMRGLDSGSRQSKRPIPSTDHGGEHFGLVMFAFLCSPHHS
jgi:hypothetical protein